MPVGIIKLYANSPQADISSQSIVETASDSSSVFDETFMELFH